MKIHHIAIAVDDIDSAKKIFKKAFNCTFTNYSIIKEQAVKVYFFDLGGLNIELIQATSSKSPIFPILPHPIRKFVINNGWGVHHIAFEVSDINSAIDNFKVLGIDPLYTEHCNGADGKTNFLNPVFFNGLLIELVET